MSALGIAALGSLATVVAAFLGWLGVRSTGRTTSLEKAASAWEALYAKQEGRLSNLEARADRLEKSNDDLAHENRVFREVIGGVITRLRRKPPEPPDLVISYIFDRLPYFGKDE